MKDGLISSGVIDLGGETACGIELAIKVVKSGEVCMDDVTSEDRRSVLSYKVGDVQKCAFGSQNSWHYAVI